MSAAVIGTGLAYVSMAPGTEPGGDSVVVQRLGGGAAVGTRMSDGGFDPVAVAAETGDTLAISMHHYGGGTDTTYGIVPVKGRPTIVRTSPPEGRTDVPLNCVIQVVFNEPMDSVSLSDALHLRLNGVDVPGSVSWESTGGVILSGQFVPTASLNPGSVYEVVVSGARSLDGEALAAPVAVQFTTQSTGAPDTLAGSIQVSVHTTGAPLPAGYTILLDNQTSGQAAPVNGDVLLTHLVPGDHRVRLEGAAHNCWISESNGGFSTAPWSVVTVTRGETVPVTFAMVCLDRGTSAIDVQVERTGDPFSYFTALVLIRPDGLSQIIQPGFVAGLSTGSYQVLLTGGTPFRLQCAVTPPNPRTVDLGSGGGASIVFRLYCSNQ